MNRRRQPPGGRRPGGPGRPGQGAGRSGGPRRRGPGGSSRRPPPRRPAPPPPPSEETIRRREAIASLVDPEVTIDRLVQGGLGFARWQGIPILVEDAVAGDQGRIEVLEKHPDYVKARFAERRESGPDRVEPTCVHAGICGGCDLQHLRHDRQLEAKASAALESLWRIGKLAGLPDPRLIAGSPLGYRTRAQVHLQPPAAANEPSEGESASSAASLPSDQPDPARWKVGFKQRRGDQVVDVERCPVLAPTLQEALTQLRRVVRATSAEVEDSAEGASGLPRRIDLLAGRDDRWTSAPVVEGLPHDGVEIEVELAEGERHRLGTDARCFFQGNAGLAGRLVEEALDGLEEVGTAWDLYAGVGLFSLPLLRRCSRLVAVESDRIAVRHLRRNLRRAASGGAPSWHVDAISVDRFLETVREQDEEPRPDLLLLDPPRTGLSRRALRGVLTVGAPTLRYVSCNPATLARDLARLANDYEIRRLAFVDLFPQTSHLETVVHLERTST